SMGARMIMLGASRSDVRLAARLLANPVVPAKPRPPRRARPAERARAAADRPAPAPGRSGHLPSPTPPNPGAPIEPPNSSGRPAPPHSTHRPSLPPVVWSRLPKPLPIGVALRSLAARTDPRPHPATDSAARGGAHSRTSHRTEVT